MPSVSAALWDDSVRLNEAQEVTSSHACRVVRPGVRAASDPAPCKEPAVVQTSFLAVQHRPFRWKGTAHSSSGSIPWQALGVHRPQESLRYGVGDPLGRSIYAVKGSGNTGWRGWAEQTVSPSTNLEQTFFSPVKTAELSLSQSLSLCLSLSCPCACGRVSPHRLGMLWVLGLWVFVTVPCFSCCYLVGRGTKRGSVCVRQANSPPLSCLSNLPSQFFLFSLMYSPYEIIDFIIMCSYMCIMCFNHANSCYLFLSVCPWFLPFPKWLPFYFFFKSWFLYERNTW